MEAHAAEMVKQFRDADAKYGEIKDMLSGVAALRMEHSELEAQMVDRARELTRLLFQGHLDLRSELETPPLRLVGSDGEVRTHRRRRSRSLVSVFGLVTVARTVIGGRGLEGLAPMDAELNLPKTRYSFGLERCVVDEAIRGSFDETVDAVTRRTGVRVPKRQAEQIVRRAAEDFEVFYAAGGGQLNPDADEPDDLLVLTVDGKGVTMLPDSLREATRQAAARRSHKLDKRLSSGEKRNRRRMATVASVYTIAAEPRTTTDIVSDLRPVRDVSRPKRPRPKNKRVWASVALDAETVMADMFAEALRRDPSGNRRWVAVVDGNKTQLRVLKALADKAGIELTIVLDIIHVIEYLWLATTAVYGEGNRETERVVAERLAKILDGKAAAVAAGIKQSATKRKLSSHARKRMRKAANYLLNNRAFLRYDKYLAAGMPIASGVIEGACRHLVKDRMDITGARWGLETAEAVLKMRAIKTSGDLEAYWCFHQRQHRDRVHGDLYEQSRTLDKTPQRSHLTLLPGGAEASS